MLRGGRETAKVLCESPPNVTARASSFVADRRFYVKGLGKHDNGMDDNYQLDGRWRITPLPTAATDCRAR